VDIAIVSMVTTGNLSGRLEIRGALHGTPLAPCLHL
jgi:hypothetical protein